LPILFRSVISKIKAEFWMWHVCSIPERNPIRLVPGTFRRRTYLHSSMSKQRNVINRFSASRVGGSRI
jgi:hypothetical protein